MKTIWQGSDSLFLIKTPKELTFLEKYYVLKFRFFAKFIDYFTSEHYACGKLTERNLKLFGVKKKIIQFQDLINNDIKIEKIPHEGFNILYYFPKRTKFREWLYGWDIFLQIKEYFKNRVNFIVVNGSSDMKEIYPITDLLIRPNRHDGLPRMVKECELNNIPCISTFENPSLEIFIIEIENKIKRYKKPSPGINPNEGY